MHVITILILILEVGCRHPGKVVNGFVFPDLSEQLYSFGQNAEIACRDGYMLQGPSAVIYCTDKSTWSEDLPTCIKAGRIMVSRHLTNAPYTFNAEEVKFVVLSLGI